MSFRKNYDPECFELAQYFLRDEAPELKECASDLAAHIQEAIEDWIDITRSELAEAKEPHAR